MANIEDIAINVLMEAVECPSTVAEFAVLRAAREFCRETGCWRTTVGLPLVAGVGEYNLNDVLGVAPYATGEVDYRPEFLQIVSVAPVGRSPLTAKTQDQLDTEWPSWRTQESSSPRYYLNYTSVAGDELDGDGAFRIVPRPSTSSLAATVSDISREAQAVITFTADHSFVEGDRLRLTGFSALAGGWSGMHNKEVRVISVDLDNDQVTVDLDTSGYATTYAASKAGTQTASVIDLDVRVTLMPGRDATALPNSLLRYYEEAIISGAIWYVCSMDESAWSNPNKAATHKMLFMEAISSGRTKAADENTSNVRRRVAYGGL